MVEFEYKISTKHNRIHGKLLNLNQDFNDKGSIITVAIYGDKETIVYKTEWDLYKTDEIIIDEALDKIRTLKFRISFDSRHELNLAMSDFFVSADGDI